MKEAHEHDPPITSEDVEAAEQQLASNLGDELKHLVEVVRFGHETEIFLKQNPVGRYLVAKAEADLAEATRQLLDMDSLRGKKARDVHAQARVAVAVLRWLDEAISAGREAELAAQAVDVVRQE